ncbi:MAG TPA: ABC transporter permease [Mycobacteriales bacterium]|nr:ABC transporter permease [Mycobacteriales bacterium]
MRRVDPRAAGLAIGAPVLAVLFAALLSSIALVISGSSPIETFQSIVDYGTRPHNLIEIVNKSVTYYLSGLAVAIGFRMNLFNIGVDGQYRIAAFAAAVVGAAVPLPGVLRIVLVILVAVVVGALWAGLAAVLKVTRGVSEVISTIMLNAIAGGLVFYFLSPERLGVQATSNQIRTELLPADSWFPNFALSDGTLYGFVLVAIGCGAAYWVLLNRTRFGFDLRATGLSESAAVASGVNVKRMVVASMLLSGGVAGLVGLPVLLSDTHYYGQDFPLGYGFTGIAIALLGRNHPVGIAFGALLWSFLERSSLILDIQGVPKEIVTIMQGVTVLSVVIAYELVRRFGLVRQQRRVAAELSAQGAEARA